MDPSSTPPVRTRRLRPTLLWGFGVAAVMAVAVEVSRTGLDILFLILLGLMIIVLERTVGDWLGELLGSGIATILLGSCVCTAVWILFERGGMADRFFAAAALRGYSTSYYQVPDARLPAASGASPVASTGTFPAGTPAVSPARGTTSAGPTPPTTAPSPPAQKPVEPGSETSVAAQILGLRTASELNLRVPTPAVAGERLVIRARLTSDGAPVSGSVVTFTADIVPIGIGTTGSDGTASTTFTPRLAGTYNIRAFYPGDSRYSASSATATLTVVQGWF